MKRSYRARVSCIYSWICSYRQGPQSASSPTRTMARSLSSSTITYPTVSLQHTLRHLPHSTKNSLSLSLCDVLVAPMMFCPYDFIYVCVYACRIGYTRMIFCSQCQQFHSRPEDHLPTCTTYQKFSYLLKDEFMRWNKQEATQAKRHRHLQQSKLPAQSHPPHPQEGTRTALSQQGALNRRIERLIKKSRGCRQHRKECNHLQSTSCDEHMSPADEAPLDLAVKTLMQQEERMEVRVIPCERLFEKPFNSRMLNNPIVYDSLTDNRLCGVYFSEEGEAYMERGGGRQ